MIAVADVAPAEAVQASGGVADCLVDWRAAVERSDVDAVVVATPNAFLVEIAVSALQSGKHVLVEKPPGCNAAEAAQLVSAARAAGRTCKVGFNHRYHPAIRGARELFVRGELGRLLNLRARYGHGGRPGLEREWRADPVLAGGGELLDQGIHVLDLFRWFAGEPVTGVAMVQTAAWPIAPLEDNAFVLLRFADGVVGQLHASTTQWKNLFSLEVCCERGTLMAEGLGGSYGTERLTVVRRSVAGGAPQVEEHSFDTDDSWQAEWDAFLRAIASGTPVDGDAEDGAAVMRVLDGLYRSAQAGEVVRF